MESSVSTMQSFVLYKIRLFCVISMGCSFYFENTFIKEFIDIDNKKKANRKV